MADLPAGKCEGDCEGEPVAGEEGKAVFTLHKARDLPASLRTAAAIRNHATPKVANLPTFPLAGNIASSGDVP